MREERVAARPIALLSDFGTNDPYVGMVHAVLADLAPGAPRIDLLHAIPPQDVVAGSFVLAGTVPFLPNDAVVWAVVDPGVGTERAAVVVDAVLPAPAGPRRRTFVAPDNGLLTETLEAGDVVGAVRIDESRIAAGRPLPRSATFHGRDVFAPAAARIARGDDPAELGVALDPDRLARLNLPVPQRAGGGWRGTVRWVDRFGDLVTDLPSSTVAPGSWRVRAGGLEIDRISSTFADVAEGADLAYVGSWGTLEIAVRGGSAAGRWDLAPGDVVELLPG